MAAQSQTVYQQTQRGERDRGIEQPQGGAPVTEFSVRSVPEIPAQKAPYDSETYKAQLEAQTARRLAELEAEIRRLSQKRTQEKESYLEQTQSQMDAVRMNAEGREPDGTPKVQEVFVPQSIKAKAGTGEAKRQHKG